MSATAQTVVYDNSQTPLGSYFASQSEIGDEIKIGNGWVAHTFTFEYYANNLSGGEKATVRFYGNDGVELGPGVLAPGSVLWTSPEITLNNGNYAPTITDLLPLNVALPNHFTWAVKVSGLAAGETFGLKLYDPPAVGSSFSDMWVFTPEGWNTATIPGAKANFGATLTAVPEPGTLTLLGLGGLALFLRKRASRS